MRTVQSQQPSLLLPHLSASRMVRSHRQEFFELQPVSLRLRHYASNPQLCSLQRHAARISESERRLQADSPRKYSNEESL
jgi:hypothetical protein